jgi:hypothetical protein
MRHANLSDLKRTLEHDIKALTQTKARSSSVYEELMLQLTSSLRTLVDIPDAERTRYLNPLFDLAAAQGGDMTIATLNYDRSVEMCGELLGRPVNTGIEEWIKTGRFTNTDGIRLLKLHGSIEWRLVSTIYGRDGVLGATRVTADPTEDVVNARTQPAVVFGQRGKLRAAGPFLELLAEFDRALALADHLLVVGYSFRDEHVNEYIRRWLNADSAHLITVIDPAFPGSQGGWGPRADYQFHPRRPVVGGNVEWNPTFDFQSELQRNLVAGNGKDEKWQTRLHVERSGARAGLASAAAALLAKGGSLGSA